MLWQTPQEPLFLLQYLHDLQLSHAWQFEEPVHLDLGGGPSPASNDVAKSKTMAAEDHSTFMMLSLYHDVPKRSIWRAA